jgi:hypothetical protein
MLPFLALQSFLDWEFSDYNTPLSEHAPFISAESCRSCHSKITAQWEQSRHAQSWSNPIFQEGYIAEPDPFCVYCHAPHAEQRIETLKNDPWVRSMHPVKGSLLNRPERYPEPLADEGINCATCHVRDGKMIASEPKPFAPHPITVDTRIKESVFCKDCHDFPILERHNGALIVSTTYMQTTYQEWETWKEKGGDESCQGCHMPEGRHDFHGANHRPLLKKSLQVQVYKEGHEVIFVLESIGVGHHLPTGDLFRHLTLDLFIENSWKEVAYIGRTFTLEWEDERANKRLVSDTALRPGEKREYRTKWKTGMPWRVVYHYGSKTDEARTLLPYSVLTEVLIQGKIQR